MNQSMFSARYILFLILFFAEIFLYIFHFCVETRVYSCDYNTHGICHQLDRICSVFMNTRCHCYYNDSHSYIFQLRFQLSKSLVAVFTQNVARCQVAALLQTMQLMVDHGSIHNLALNTVLILLCADICF